jgi:hypothetical protein
MRLLNPWCLYDINTVERLCHLTLLFQSDMVCSGCGHEFVDHKSITQSMHFCNKCQQLESYVSFSEKEKATAPPAGPGEALSNYFKTATE